MIDLQRRAAAAPLPPSEGFSAVLLAVVIVSAFATIGGHYLHRPPAVRAARKEYARAMGWKGQAVFLAGHIIPFSIWMVVFGIIAAGLEAYGYRATTHGWHFVAALAGIGIAFIFVTSQAIVFFSSTRLR